MPVLTWGGGGIREKDKLGGLKNAHEAHKNDHFYAEIVKFDLIFTDLKLFWVGNLVINRKVLSTNHVDIYSACELAFTLQRLCRAGPRGKARE